VFPAPQASYTVDSFPGELILIPALQPGSKVPCLFLPFQHARFIFIYFHANAEDLGVCHQFCQALRDLFQVHILVVEYPGYGICPGVCTEEGILSNATAAMKFVTETLKWPCDGVKLLGRSLGTGPSIALATQYSVAGLILVTPFISIKEIFRFQVGKVAEFVQERFPNQALAHKIKSPTLIIHGQQDNLIPCEHGRAIYDSVRTKKMLVCPQGMNHNSGLLQNVGDFVLPMTQFFALPDYTFEDVVVPDWVFPKTTARKIAQNTGDGEVREAALCGTSVFCGTSNGRLGESRGRLLQQDEPDVQKDSSDQMLVMPPKPCSLADDTKPKEEESARKPPQKFARGVEGVCDELLGRAGRNCSGAQDSAAGAEANDAAEPQDFFVASQKDAANSTSASQLSGMPMRLPGNPDIGVIRWHL